MTVVTPDEVEQFRHECEAREWLRRGYNTKEKIRVLRVAIAKHRGEAAADRLIEEMRRQWKKGCET